MKKPWCQTFLLSVVACFAFVGIAGSAVADDINFMASVDRDKVAVGDRLVLSLTITGARNATEPQLPPMDGFQVMSSGTTSQFNFIQGRMFASRSFTYVLMPQKIGKFTIGPARMDYDGGQYTTQPIEVEVVDGGASGGGHAAPTAARGAAAGGPGGRTIDLGDRLFIAVKADKDELYINEQVILTFRLFRKCLNVDGLQYTPPPTVGFIEESLGKQKESRELVHGEMYDVIELKTALFPASTGDLTIGPATLKCNVLVRTQQRREQQEEGFFGGLFDESFFGGDPFYQRLAKVPVELKSNPVTIRVKPLPTANKPPDFQGAVGDYQMEAWVKGSNVKVGEPVNLTMKVIGTGNISSLAAPSVGNLEGFKSYDSESKVNLQERIDAIGGEKVFERVLIPQKAGKMKIPPVKFSFFNPSKGKYETVSEGPFWLDVEESADSKSSVIVSAQGNAAPKEDVQILKRDILFIKDQLGTVYDPARAIENRPVFWLLQGFPLLLLLGTVLLRRRSEKMEADVGRSRWNKAYGCAKEGFQQAEKALAAGGAGFYQALYRSLSEYLSDRWNLPPGEITPQEVTKKFDQMGSDAILAQKARDIVEHIDQGRFARVGGNAQEMRQLYEEAWALVKELNRSPTLPSPHSREG